MAAESKSADEVAAAQAQLAERQKNKSVKDSECADLLSQLAYCKETKDEIIEFKKVYGTKIQASQNSLAENEKLTHIRAELESQLEAAKKELENGRLQLDASTGAARDVASIKAVNDDVENSIVLPGKDEIVRLIKEKEQLAKIISQGHEESAVAQEREKEEAKMKADELKAAKTELGTVKESLEGKKVKKQHFDRVQQESRENWEREISEHVAVEEKYMLAYEAESKHREDAYQSRKHEFEVMHEQMKSESELRCAAIDRHLHILLYGTEIIQHAGETVHQLNEDPITI
jgi:hypothetical protein